MTSWTLNQKRKQVVRIDADIVRKAERLIESCEQCNEEGAEIPFDNILDRITGSDPSVTEFGAQRTYASEGTKDMTL